MHQPSERLIAAYWGSSRWRLGRPVVGRVPDNLKRALVGMHSRGGHLVEEPSHRRLAARACSDQA
eukprot:11017969-Prorocentrum_lima.AAC.1